MTGLRTNTYITKVAAIAWILFAFGSAEGLILCCGDDGHVALEASVVGTCCNSVLSMDSQKVSSSVLSLKDHCSISPCGLCVDILLSSGQKALYSSQDRNKRPAAAAKILYKTSVAYSLAARNTTLCDSPAATPSPFDNSPALLSCTVLLI